MGLTLAAIGVTLVVWRKLEAGFGTMEGVLLCVLALCGITAATLYQKRFCGAMDLRSGSVIQYTAAGLAAGLGSFIFEEQRIDWTGELLFALARLVLLLSLGAPSIPCWPHLRAAADG